MASDLALIERELKRRQSQMTMIDDELSIRSIDIESGNKDQIRQAIGGLPERLQQRARRRWADFVVKTERTSQAKSTVGNITQTVDDTVRNLARGSVVGPYLDEFGAWVNSGFDGESPKYYEGLAYERAKDRAVDADYGIAGAATKLVGGVSEAVANPLGIAWRGGTYLGNIARGSAYGAGHSAVSGFGSGEGGPANRMKSAGSGAKFGAVLGGAIPAATGVIAPAIGGLYSRIRPAVTPYTSGPQRAADLSIASRVRDAGDGDLRRGVNSLVDDINAGQRARHMGPNSVGQLPETLADRSNGLQRLAGTVYRQGGRGGEAVSDSLTSRQRGPGNLYDRGANVQTNQIGQRGQARDMYEQFERALRVRTSDTPAQTIRRLRQDASDEGKQLYGAAMQNQQPFRIDNEIAAALRRSQDMGATPIGRSLRKAARYFMGSPTSPRGHQMSPLERFDTAKKALDDDIGAAVKSNKGNLARELTEFKNRMLARVDEGNPDYATARSAWGGRKEQQEAVEMGRSAFKESSEITADAYRALSVPLQKLFRVGMLDAQRAMTRTANPGTDVSRLFQQQRVVELMREVIPNSRRPNDVFWNRSGRFGEYVNRQGRMAQTRNTVMGGSPTARNQLDDNAEAIRTLSQVWDQFRQNPSITRMLMDGVGVLGNRYLGFRKDVSVQIARRLMQMNPEAQIRYLQGLERRVGADPLRGFMEGLQNLSQHAIREGSKAAGRNLVEENEAR